MARASRSISSLVAAVIMVAVAIAVGVALAGLILGVFSSNVESTSRSISIVKARYFYFTSKPLPYVPCEAPPCGVLVVKVRVEGGPMRLERLSFAGYTWDLSLCQWFTSSGRALDPGYNILVFRSPDSSPPCRIISEEGSENLYRLWDAVLAAEGRAQLLSRLQLRALQLFSTLHVEPPTDQWMYIVADGKVYQCLVKGSVVTG